MRAVADDVSAAAQTVPRRLPSLWPALRRPNRSLIACTPVCLVLILDEETVLNLVIKGPVKNKYYTGASTVYYTTIQYWPLRLLSPVAGDCPR